MHHATSSGGVSGGIGPGGMRQPSRAARLALRARFGRQQVEQAVAVVGREGVEIDELGDARARAVGDAGRDHAAIGMADQIDVAQVLEFQHAEDIGDVGLEIDVGPRQMGALAEPGIGRRDQPVAARAPSADASSSRPSRRTRRHARRRMSPLPLPYSAATARVRAARLFQRARTKSSATTASPAASTSQPGRMPASKSNAAPSTRRGDT